MESLPKNKIFQSSFRNIFRIWHSTFCKQPETFNSIPSKQYLPQSNFVSSIQICRLSHAHPMFLTSFCLWQKFELKWRKNAKAKGSRSGSRGLKSMFRGTAVVEKINLEQRRSFSTPLQLWVGLPWYVIYLRLSSMCLAQRTPQCP